MECQNVDRAALAADVERHLGGGDPLRGSEHGEQLVHEHRVSRVEESVQALRVPQKADIDAGAEFRGDPAQGQDGHAISLAALDSTDDGTG